MLVNFKGIVMIMYITVIVRILKNITFKNMDGYHFERKFISANRFCRSGLIKF